MSPLHIFISKYQPEKEKKKSRLQVWVTGWGFTYQLGSPQHKAEGSAERNQYNMLKRASSFQESFVVTSSTHIQQTHLGASRMGTVHTGGLEQKVGGQWWPQIQLFLRGPSTSTGVRTEQTPRPILAALVLPSCMYCDFLQRPALGITVSSSSFYCNVMIIARSQRRASNELHAVILFVCFVRVCLSSAKVWDLFQYRKRLQLQIWTSHCQRERSVFLLTDCFFFVKQQADTILFSLPLKKRPGSLILLKEN